VNSVDFSGVLQTVLAITTIIGVALAGLQRGVVTNLREANKDLRDRAGDLEKERDECAAETKRLKSDLEALGRVVSNEVQIAAFGERLEHHHEEAKGYWRASTEQGQQIIDALRRLQGGTGG
jgi:hypothetical protein